jgi:hypothetical protein
LHETDEDVLERTLLRVDVGEGDAKLVEPPEQRRNAGIPRVGIEIVVDGLSAIPERKAPRAKPSGKAASGACRCSVSCLRPSFDRSAFFSSTRISSPLLMTPILSAISSASSM